MQAIAFFLPQTNRCACSCVRWILCRQPMSFRNDQAQPLECISLNAENSNCSESLGFRSTRRAAAGSNPLGSSCFQSGDVRDGDLAKPWGG
ncbi:hypothetical protein MCP1_640011 [Candidatus Terasakiella magnetica]|nr:hypothetical protein MCP1_640011 [Candidatus Terasakiella magnetica]